MAAISAGKIATTSLVLVALALIAIAAGVRAREFQPAGQTELDLVRGVKTVPWEARVLLEKDRRYYESRFGLAGLADRCGKSVANGFAVVVNRSFSDATAVSVVGEEMARVRYPPNLPPAYLPRSTMADDDEGVFNAAAASVKFKRDRTTLTWWQQQWLAWEIRRSGILRRPYSLAAKKTLDGSGATITICDRGLRYEYVRDAHDMSDERRIEAVLGRLLAIVGAV